MWHKCIAHQPYMTLHRTYGTHYWSVLLCRHQQVVPPINLEGLNDAACCRLRTLWYEIAACLCMTPRWSPNKSDGCSTFTPGKCIMYWIEMSSSTAVLIAESSVPKVEVSVAPGSSLEKTMGVRPRNIISPVMDFLVNLLCAWSESTNAVILIESIFGFVDSYQFLPPNLVNPRIGTCWNPFPNPILIPEA